jgi:hypothetical protein
MHESAEIDGALCFEDMLLENYRLRVAQQVLRDSTQELIGLSGATGTPRITGMQVTEDGMTVECSVTLAAHLDYIQLEFNTGESMPIQFEPWFLEIPESDLDETATIQEVDPRVDSTHQVGVLPVPANPPPPVGWEYWGKQPVPHAAASLANDMLHNPRSCPIGTFVRIKVDGVVIGARVEWHDTQGATGKKGCFRGVNLLCKMPEVPEVE